LSNIIVCSFYTDDEYYQEHGSELRANLQKLGLEHVVQEIKKQPGQDWADLCRQKVPFLDQMCRDNPEKKVFWIDVDCRLLSFPTFVSESTADIIGFQRGFSKPLTIGYQKRSRFWEPCFWGVNTSEHARQMVSDAADVEHRSTIKATDDYFFEEGWRANSEDLTFQVIPSVCVAGKGDPQTNRSAFFSFGASGNVAEFKGKVAQHSSGPDATDWKRRGAKQQIIRVGKKLLQIAPPKFARKVTSVADSRGLTNFLTSGSDMPSSTRPGRTLKQQRSHLTNTILRAGMNGESEELEGKYRELLELGVPTNTEIGTLEAARSFDHYMNRESSDEMILGWWPRPFPGNFGDWLSPLILAEYTVSNIRFHSLPSGELQSLRHVVSVGSVGRFIRSSSIVVGTGISSLEHEMNPYASYVSVRGPLSAKHLRDCGGPSVESFGDPAAVMSRLFPRDREHTNGRTAFVRHFKHRNLPISFPESFDELEVLMGMPNKIDSFLDQLIKYERVVTSAMHVMIVCQSYGIPCALVSFDGFLDAVPGSGMKYSDYNLGVGNPAVTPVPIPLALQSFDFDHITREDIVSSAHMDTIESALRQAVRLAKQ